MMQQSLKKIETNDDAPVRHTIATYLAALRTAEKSLFLDAFAGTAKVGHRSIAEGTFKELTLQEFVEEVKSLHAANGYVEEFHSDPVVTVTGPVASVHVPFVLKLGEKEVTGTDVFALAKVDDQWKIVNKLYSA